MTKLDYGRRLAELGELMKESWVPVCGVCAAFDQSHGNELLHKWHQYGDGDHGEYRIGPEPTPGSCALKVSEACQVNPNWTPIGEGVLRVVVKIKPPRFPKFKKNTSKKSAPDIYPPWPKVE